MGAAQNDKKRDSPTSSSYWGFVADPHPSHDMMLESLRSARYDSEAVEATRQRGRSICPGPCAVALFSVGDSTSRFCTKLCRDDRS